MIVDRIRELGTMRILARLVLAALIAGTYACEFGDDDGDGICDEIDAETSGCSRVYRVAVPTPNFLCVYNFRYTRIGSYGVPACKPENLQPNTVVTVRGNRGSTNLQEVYDQKVDFVSARLIGQQDPCPPESGQ